MSIMLKKIIHDIGGIIQVLQSGNNKFFDNKTNSQCANNKINSGKDNSFTQNDKYFTHNFAYLNQENNSGKYIHASKAQIYISRKKFNLQFPE